MRIGIVGATGKVGRMMLTCMEEADIGVDELYLYASARSVGTLIEFKGKEYSVRELNDGIYDDGLDYVLFAAGGSVSKQYASGLVDVGVTVIDNSSAYRQVEGVPLVVPEVNGELLNGYKGIVANPNCSTIQLVLVLKPLNDLCKIKKVVVTTLQSVSGAGYNGINELLNQRKGVNNIEVFPKQIYMNLIPQIGEIGEDDYCFEESKMRFETKKILNDMDFNLVATTVRVPVVYGHSESVYIEFENKVDIGEIRDVLAKSKSVVLDDEYMTPLEIGDSDMSHVSRIRYAGDDRSVLLWNVGHNVRLGAAVNAVRVLEQLTIDN